MKPEKGLPYIIDGDICYFSLDEGSGQIERSGRPFASTKAPFLRTKDEFRIYFDIISMFFGMTGNGQANEKMCVWFFKNQKEERIVRIFENDLIVYDFVDPENISISIQRIGMVLSFNTELEPMTFIRSDEDFNKFAFSIARFYGYSLMKAIAGKNKLAWSFRETKGV